MAQVQTTVKSFADIAKQYVAVEKKLGNIFGELINWTVVQKVNADNSKEVFKQAEAQYMAKSGNDLQEIGAYRSAKSVIRSALAAGISLLDANGNAKGKSQLESETKEAKGDKTELEKFEQLFGTLSTIADKLSKTEKATAKAKLEALIAKMK